MQPVVITEKTHNSNCIHKPVGNNPPKLMDRVRADLRVRHYSLSTERTYCHWIKRYIHWSDMRDLVREYADLHRPARSVA